MERHRLGTERQLAVGGCGLLFVVGGGLVWLMLGRGAALVAVTIVGAVAGLGLIVWLLLTLLQRWANRDPD